MNRVLVAGGSGFVGANTVKRFVNLGCQVFVLCENDDNLWRLSDYMFSVNIRRVDFSDFKAIKKTFEDIRPEIVINCISYGGLIHERVEEKIYNINFQASANVIRACTKVGFDVLINIGSSEEYGQTEGKIDENCVPKPTTDYGVAKSMTTNFALQFAYAQGLPVYCIRPFAVYGDFTPREKLIGSLFLAAYKGVPAHLRSPNSIRDFLYVEDLVDMIMLIFQKRPKGQYLFNAGTGIKHSALNVVTKIQKILGKKIEIEWGREASVPYKPEIRIADSTLAKNVLSWSPSYDLDQGLKATSDWFENNFSYYETDDNLREVMTSIL